MATMLPPWLRELRRRWFGPPRRRPRRAVPPVLMPLEPRVLPSFQPAVTVPAGTAPHSVLLADLNRDGLPDLVAADYNSASVSVSLGQPGGSFGPARSFATGTQPGGLAVGDFNGDGKPDLATA